MSRDAMTELQDWLRAEPYRQARLTLMHESFACLLLHGVAPIDRAEHADLERAVCDALDRAALTEIRRREQAASSYEPDDEGEEP